MLSDPKIYSAEEIELFLAGDRREIDKLLLTSVNGLASSFVSFRDGEFRVHAKREEAVLDALGPADEVRAKWAWVDAEIARKRAWAKFWDDMRTEAGKKLLWVMFTVLTGLIVYWWSGNVPTVTTHTSAKP